MSSSSGRRWGVGGTKAGTAVTELAQAVGGRGIDRVPRTGRFDPRRHRRVPGLLDLWLVCGPRGRPALPTEPDRPLDAPAVADLVRRTGDAADDVRILADDGARHADLFTEVAGLLGHDVLVSPDGADIRQVLAGRAPDADDGPLHALPLDRVTRQPMDWLVLQPPDLATPLPGWFAMEDGLVRPRTGVVNLPLATGVALATRADFVARRATAHRLGASVPELVTVSVTARFGGFLIGDYSGTQQVRDAGHLAALLGELPLYGADLRLWLTWPSEPDEQVKLVAQAADLAEITGATVWTPPPGGRAELVGDRRDLRALDAAGGVAAWQAHRPRYADGPSAVDATADGMLVPRSSRQRIVVVADAQATAAPAGSTPDATGPGGTVSAGTASAGTGADGRGAGRPAPGARPTLAAESRRAGRYGPPWLHPGQQVNVATFEAFVPVTGDLERAATEGVPTAELCLVAHLDPRSAPRRTDLLRVRIAPGGAIPVQVLRSHVPARLQYLLGAPDTYLLPAGRLDRVQVREAFRATDEDGLRRVDGLDGGALRIRSAPASASSTGLPHDVTRWPAHGTRRAYALLPARSRGLAPGWLPLSRRRPAPRAGRLLVEVRVPRGRTVDVGATADALAALPLARGRAERLRQAGVDLILTSRSYERVQVDRVHRARDGVWETVPGAAAGPLPVVLRGLQSPPVDSPSTSS
ncbi:hypothetical protein ACFFKH_09650 [Micromonospora marina]|uniref:Uncharacterized protein n=1 Tax=Micromonospora marina TaxID=307120 RepID=A0A1C4XAZ1_9ACTN|nr:hypothetical protein [Micromonospora marina]SCF05555.1 hypothetical protein GA0070215_10719 [Micromonospora marina]